MKRIFLTLTVLSFGLGFAQMVDNESLENIEACFEATVKSKSTPKDKKKEIKGALGDLSKEGVYLADVEKKPDDALKFYLALQELNPDCAELNYKIGVLYTRTSFKFKALNFFEHAYKLNPKINNELLYNLGKSYQINYDFDVAIEKLREYKTGLRPGTDGYDENKKKADKSIMECESGIALMKTPVRVWIDNMGTKINGKYPEYGARISADEGSVFYTARRPETTGGGTWNVDGGYYEDIVFSDRDKETNEWSASKGVVGKVNSKSHDAIAGLAPDGYTVFIFKGDVNGGDLFVATKNEGEWSKPEPIKGDINTKKAKESTAAITFDGKRLYFVSSREGGQGGSDIYYSDWNEDKERWGTAVNLGATVNTEYDEKAIFLHPDGKTLYFASKGHNTMGGFDIFYSVNEDGVWTTPKNIGYPINTPDDDLFFVLSSSGRRGYYASFKEDGHGEKDIYVITFLGPAKEPQTGYEDRLIACIGKPIPVQPPTPVDPGTKNVAIMTGIVVDCDSKAILGADIEVIDLKTGAEIAKFKSDPTTGKYEFPLPSGKNYSITFKKDGYLLETKNVDLPEASGYKKYETTTELCPVKVGMTFNLNNVFFDLNKASLRPESRKELDNLVKIMNDHPEIRIELQGHTDSRGSAAYNKDLSQRRAQSVVDYLVDAGIDRARLEAQGYGEESPNTHEDKNGENKELTEAYINSYKSKSYREDLHQLNRRTMVLIIE